MGFGDGLRENGRAVRESDAVGAAARRNVRRSLTGAVLLAAAGALQLTARNMAGFGEWYATTVYPLIVGTYGRFCGIFPFSVAEILLYGLILWGVLGIACQIWTLVRPVPEGKVRRLGAELRTIAAAWLSRLVFVAGLMAFLYTVCCGINYYRLPFSSYLDLEVRESSTEELRALCEYLTEKVNETVDDASYDASWKREGQLAMSGLAELYPQLKGYYPRPKGLLFSRILSVQQLCGVYLPFTVEANYNREMTAYGIPHAICHELSHLRGFMREDEANFIGYLACVNSASPSFRYSGYLTGWVYAGNALAAQDIDAYRALYARLNERSAADLRENNVFWKRYEGRVAEVSGQMNDVYLKINDQQDGVKSYGRMVDLMLAYYRDGAF